MIFGSGSCKFVTGSETIILNHSRIIPNYCDMRMYRHKSVELGDQLFESYGEHSDFIVEVELSTYTSSYDKFNDIYRHLYDKVYFWPHQDGIAVSNSLGEAIEYIFSDIKLEYHDNKLFNEKLSLTFLSTDYTNLSGSVIY